MNEVFEYLDSFGPVYALPVVHYRVEFAEAVRHAFKNLIPDAVAVELPFSLQPFIERGIQRLPAASVVIYQNKKGDTIYFPIEPADPIVEAVRLGLESKTPVYFIDPDIDEYPEYRDYLPDTYGVYRLGIRTYYDLYRTTALPVIKKGPEDIRRERGMAYHLKELAGQYRRILFVCGMLHLEDVKKGFKHPQAMPLSILKREDVALFNLHPDDICEVFTEYPFLSAVYEYRRNGLPPKPDLSRYTVRKKIGTLTLLDGGKDSYSEEDALDASIRWTVHRLESGPLDRQKVMYHLFEQAAKHYHQDTGESVTPWQKRIFFRFSGNYARLDNLLVPDFYHLLVSARGSVDDNFCYAFWRLGSFYPWQDVISEVPTARLQGELLHLETRKIYIRRMIPRIKRHPIYVPQKRRLKEQRPGEWLEGFRNPYICSYPPEDLVIEDYGNFLKTKGRLILSEERSVSVPFQTTILDGIDIRETVRHIHEGRIYVRELKRIRGGVGSVIVIFDPDKEGDRFPYLMTWLGEHDQESDMAFYATDPLDHIVGPGISRCQYGGFMMTYPPLRLADVWNDPDYMFAESKAERLLLAGLDYSLEKYVVYIASEPPRSYIKQVASRSGKQIVYIPIGQLSSIKLKQIRTFHILAGKDKREIAKDYIS